MLVYILKSVACLAILFVFYKIFLEKENMHVFKRFYLLGALVISLIIPAIVFTEYVEVIPTNNIQFVTPGETGYSNDALQVPQALDKDINDIALLLWIAYFIGLFFFGLKFLRNLVQIFRRIRRNPKHKLNRFTQVLLKETMPPHTFFSYIFLNKTRLESNEIPKEVLLHEETHASQKHSYDVVLVEILQVIFWVNPLVYFFKKAIKLNHEFLADQAVLKKNIDKATYQNTLLSYLSPDSKKKYQPKLANAINYSSIKKRFKIMKTHTSKRAIFLRTLLLLPLMAVLLYGFSETKFIETVPIQSEQVIQKTLWYPTETAEDIQIKIDENGRLLIQDEFVALENLKDFLSKITIDLSVNQKQNLERAFIYVETDTPENIINEVNQILTDYNVATINIVGPNNDLNQKGVTREQIIEYNALSKKYYELPTGDPIYGNGNIGRDLKRMRYIFNLMSENQKKEVEPLTNIPPMPIAKKSQESASRKQMAEYNALAKKYNSMLSKSKSIQIKMKDVERLEYIYGLMSEKQKADAEAFPDFPPMPPSPKAPKAPKAAKAAKAAKVKKGEKSNIPPPPPAPEPVEPIDHVIEMAKNDAMFYYEGKKVTSDKAIELLKGNKNLNIQSTGKTTIKPVVKISKKPIELDRSAQSTSIETGNIDINGEEGFYSIKNGMTSYFNSAGQQVNINGGLLAGKSKNGPKFYYNEKQISSVKADRLLSTNKSIQVANKEYPDGSYSIILTDLNSSYSKNVNNNKNPNSVIDLTNMIAKNALFFYNYKPITTEKALWLTQNNHIERVSTKESKEGKPKVYFWNKA